MLIFAFFATLVVLRITSTTGAGLPSGIALMGFGVWVLWVSAVRHHGYYEFDSIPRMASVLFGVWLVVKGALRFSA